MKGHVRKRCKCIDKKQCKHPWSYVVSLGDQPCRKCSSCNKRHWDQARPPKTCSCGAQLVDSIERRQIWQGGFKTRGEAQAAVRKVLHAADEGTFIEPSKQDFGSYLREVWLPSLQVRPSTKAAYATHVRKYLAPRLGHVPLRSLTPAAVNGLYRYLIDEGLSAATVHRIHATAHKALSDAVRWNLVAQNVAARTDRPREKRPEMQTWTAKELRRFLDGTRETRSFGLWYFIANTGVRRGEALGLRWTDLDLDASRAAIRQSLAVVDRGFVFQDPKSGKARVVALDPQTVAVLRGVRAQQAEERLALGAAYEDGGLVFCRENGAPLHPGRVSHAFHEALTALGLPQVRLHDLRHTHATLALSAGIHPKVVQERLGHSSIQITIDTYSHVAPGLDELAAQQIANLLHEANDDAEDGLR